MPRCARQCPGGYVYHVWNRAAGRLRLFKKEQDYLAFEHVLAEAHGRCPLRLLDWCLMPNHWHFAVWPRNDNEVTAFFRWLTHTHAMRSITHRRVLGMGPLYQGRFKALPVQEDAHLLTLLAYIQRNPLRAKLVKSAAAWRWSAEAARRRGIEEIASLLTDWPVDRPRDWSSWIDAAHQLNDVEQIRECVRRSRPFGSVNWTERVAARLGLSWTMRPRGRPTKKEEA